MAKVLISLSGGLDSTVLLSLLLANGDTVHAVGFSYGSKHNPFENASAKSVADHYGVPFTLIDISSAMVGFESALLRSGGDIPEGHYEHESMKQTVVPGRNLIFASIIAGLAESKQFDAIALGVHQGDHFIYPDCRVDFIEALRETIHLSTSGKIQVLAPFLNLTKSHIVALGADLKTPFELTRTCYKEQGVACGKCGSCNERREAFALNNMIDPVPYQAH